ncbi:hypothetical protein ACT17_23140 [Mycolicibacterium conceptionense]|uniref:Uncharacterized protein n=1 Tax=Mycolicibacterium conceptionense TaxID=451644 RepID=A0A0J8U6B7_9MYCO|nr:hypothetical protein [Mycolicibacterium conceptionense]KMV15985.1 hypothetical protein ACT17_23140 [Mycolicibacterium conceptionense]
MSDTTAPTPRIMANTRRTNGGDEFRAKLLDLDWIREAGPIELRHAMHALCWRFHRETVDGFSLDPFVAEKMLITARGVKGELDAKLAKVGARLDAEDVDANELSELREERAALLRRKAAADTVIATTRATVEFHRPVVGRHSERERVAVAAAVELGRAIATHREQVHPDEACEADERLWAVLDTASVPDGRAGTLPVQQLIGRIDAAEYSRNVA